MVKGRLLYNSFHRFPEATVCATAFRIPERVQTAGENPRDNTLRLTLGVIPMASCPSAPTRLRDSNSSAAAIRSLSARFSSSVSIASPSRPTCLCSPTNHPGSFRCSMHRSQSLRRSSSSTSSSPSIAPTSRLDAKAKAKAKDLRSLLMQMILPAKHNLYRRRKFQPRPSRFSVMNNGGKQQQLPSVLGLLAS